MQKLKKAYEDNVEEYLADGWKLHSVVSHLNTLYFILVKEDTSDNA